MQSISLESDNAVALVFDSYPTKVREKILHLRKLILEAANELDEVESLQETLKWGQPSYISKKGSTIRIDWKRKQKDEYAIYFQCTSSLVPTFRTVYKNVFKFEGNREISFHINDPLPEAELKTIFSVGLTYHQRKHLPLLGL